MATPAPSTATGFKKALGWYSDTEVNAPTTPAPTIQKPMVGPIQPGATRPIVDVPNPALTPAPPSVPQNGTLQGSYPVKDTNGQTTYQAGMNVVNGVMTPNAPPTPQNMSTPAPPQSGGNGLYQDQYARSPADIAKLAADRIAKILGAGRTSAAGALAGAKDAYNYTNAIEKDTRTLEDAAFAENNGPFGGKYQYDKTNIARYRGIEDTSQDNNYNAAVGQINQKLADLEAAAPGDEQAIIDELQQIERQTGINVAQLQEQQKQNQFNNGVAQAGVTGQYQGQQTLQSKQMDADYTGNYNGSPTIQKQQLDSDNAYRDKTFDYGVSRDVANDEYRDNVFDYEKANNEWSQAFQQGQFDFTKAQTVWENNFKDTSFKESVKQAAQQLGLDYTRMNVQQQQFASEQAFREKSFKAQQDQLTFDNNLKSGEIPFSKGLEIYKSTGQMPDYMKDYGIDVAALKDPGIKDDVNALYEALSSKTLTPKDALKMIDEKVSIGSETKVDGDKLKQVIYTLNPKLNPSYVKPSKESKKVDLAPDVPSGEGVATYYLSKLWKSVFS